MTGVNAVQRETGAMPQNATTSSKQVIETEKGLVNHEAVAAIKLANIPPDAPPIKSISSNQSQEYFAVATQQGFEIIQNDSSSDKIKKKV